MDVFQLPKDFQLPEGKKEGDTVQVMATVKLMADGSAQLIEVDGSPIGGEVEESEEGGMMEGRPGLYERVNAPQPEMG